MVRMGSQDGINYVGWGELGLIIFFLEEILIENMMVQMKERVRKLEVGRGADSHVFMMPW